MARVVGEQAHGAQVRDRVRRDRRAVCRAGLGVRRLAAHSARRARQCGINRAGGRDSDHPVGSGRESPARKTIRTFGQWGAGRTGYIYRAWHAHRLSNTRLHPASVSFFGFEQYSSWYSPAHQQITHPPPRLGQGLRGSWHATSAPPRASQAGRGSMLGVADPVLIESIKLAELSELRSRRAKIVGFVFPVAVADRHTAEQHLIRRQLKARIGACRHDGLRQVATSRRAPRRRMLPSVIGGRG